MGSEVVYIEVEFVGGPKDGEKTTVPVRGCVGFIIPDHEAQVIHGYRLEQRKMLYQGQKPIQHLGRTE